MLISVPPVNCSILMKPSTAQVYQLCNTVQIVIFAQMAALSQLHMLIVWVLAFFANLCTIFRCSRDLL